MAASIKGFAPLVPSKPSSSQALDVAISPFLETPVMQVEKPKVGVLLLNLGGPETSEDVEGKLFQKRFQVA